MRIAIPDPLGLQSRVHLGRNPRFVWVPIPDPSGLQSQTHSCCNPRPIRVATLGPSALQSLIHLGCKPKLIPLAIPASFKWQPQPQLACDAATPRRRDGDPAAPPAVTPWSPPTGSPVPGASRRSIHPQSILPIPQLPPLNPSLHLTQHLPAVASHVDSPVSTIKVELSSNGFKNLSQSHPTSSDVIREERWMEKG